MNPAIPNIRQIDGRLTVLRPIYLVAYDELRAAIEESEEPLHRFMRDLHMGAHPAEVDRLRP